MAENNRYSNADLLHMQQDAIRRVREMQQRAAAKLQQTQQAMSPTGAAGEQPPNPHTNQRQTANKDAQMPPRNAPPSQAAHPQPPTAVPKEGPSAITSLFDRLGMDGEKSVLLLLIVLLLNEGADTKLILALCYLLI